MAIRFLTAALVLVGTAGIADPLPSWNDTEIKSSIIDFVDSVTDSSDADFVPVEDRIAVFDNDGTLWAEQPVYFQLIYAIDVVARKTKEDPGFASTPALKAAADGDLKALVATGEEGLLEVVNASHSGVPVDTFQSDVLSWLETARHPKTGKRYDEMVYQPMLELLRYLRDEQFQTYIVSGGGIDFIRSFAESAYNIPPSQVVGSQLKSSYQIIDGVPVVVKEPGIFFIDDGAGKPVGIENRLGKRPIIAAGNSDGDFQMLEWTTSGDGPRLGVILHHTDAEREFSYDRESPIGALSDALDAAPEREWLVIDMANDWNRVWPFE